MMWVMSQWDPGAYGRVNTLQRYVAEEALAGLSMTGAERILDVGCGDGRVTELITARLTGGSLLGVDPSAAMVAAAQERFGGAPAGKIEFTTGTAATLTYVAEFDLVTSFNALHWETHWTEALTRIAAALRTPGRAFLVFVCGGERPSVEDVLTSTARTDRWSAAFEDFEAPFVHVDPDAYASAARDVGFVVEQLEVADLLWDFADRSAFAAWMAAGTPAWTSRLPVDQRSAFIDDAVSAYAAATGSDATLRFLQCRIALSR